MVSIATSGVGHPPLASMPSFIVGPTASRTARTRARSPFRSRPTLTFIFEKPWATAHLAISAAFAGSTPDTDHLVGTASVEVTLFVLSAFEAAAHGVSWLVWAISCHRGLFCA